ncbi:MAG: helix-turn-helix transcriptional regulator [Bdellovibrionales bacterium]|nr:helix-turn-helix transcriptional regulator [Bdellovibrionales bacterium]
MENELIKVKSLLKQVVNQKKLTYDVLAKNMKTSPATIKRILNSDDLSMNTFIRFCEVLEVDFYDLIDQSRNRLSSVSEFNVEQEHYLADNYEALLLLREFVWNRPFSLACKDLGLSVTRGRKLLSEMDRVKIIEWHSKDKVKLLVRFPFQWIENGPLKKAYTEKILSSYFKVAHEVGINNRTSSKSKCRALELSLNSKAIQQFEKDVDELISKYMSISEYDLKISQSDLNRYSLLFVYGRFSPWKV